MGRLDIDTTGLLLLTDDGALSHALLSPRKHVDKTYLVEMEAALSPSDIAVLEEGVDIGEGDKTLPARVEVVGDRQILLTIQEGRYHQVKRMLHAVGNGVRSLKECPSADLLWMIPLQRGNTGNLPPKNWRFYIKNETKNDGK